MDKPKKGDQFISFDLETKSGAITQVKQLDEKYRLLAFVSSSCGYSLMSLSELSKLHKKHGKDVEFVTIWDDDEKDTWQNYRNDLKSVIEWTDLWDKTNFASNYFDLFISPSFYIVDKNGYIIEIIKGFYPKKVDKALSKCLI